MTRPPVAPSGAAGSTGRAGTTIPGAGATTIPTSGPAVVTGPAVISPTVTNRVETVVVGRDTTAAEPLAVQRMQRALGAAAPLILLPLRLEYRVVEVATPISVVAGVSDLFRADAEATVRPAAVPPRAAAVTRQPPVVGRQPPAARLATLRVDALSLSRRKEIWFRWFPEDSFSERGVAPTSDLELQALSTFDATLAGKPWHTADDAAVVSAWQTLVRSIAPARALYLLRNRAEVRGPGWEDRIGRIALLPKRVALFAAVADGTVTVLANGTDIDQTLRYTPKALQESGWLTNFEVAIGKGMGCRISDPPRLAAALAAEWIIAIGLSSGDAVDEFATLLKDAIANDAFEFLDQDTPTNNSGGTASALGEPRSDIPAFLQRATELENHVLDSPIEQAADLFGEILQVPAAIVRTAQGGGDTALEDARAMLQVVGPVLFDAVAEGVVAWSGLDEGRVLDFFAASIAARGTLPPVRFGNNPYGMLPVTRHGEVEPFAFDSLDEAKIDELVRKLVDASRKAMRAPGAPTQPVIRPGDTDVAVKLQEILKLNPVSRRLDIADVGAAATSALGCAYVSHPAWRPASYLRSLREKALALLPDPDESDKAAPLLYRLARMGLQKSIVLPVVQQASAQKVSLHTLDSIAADGAAEERRRSVMDLNVNAMARTATIPGVRAEIVLQLQRASARFSEALARLESVAARKDGDAQLERLLMETIDLFQHRIDAWATGLAYRRIVKRRRAGRAGLAGGHYGMLGRLRPTSVTAGTDGYIQAPSPHQAATTALLRSAHLRHADGPFAVDLSSARVRRAEWILDVLRKGLTLAETLGHAGERWLHDRHKDELIFAVRQRFPIRNANDASSLEIRLFDGLEFLRGNVSAFAPAMRPTMNELKAALSADLDTLSDLVMAEAVHQRAHGHAGAANAWLQVLSGQPVPGKPAVLRTVRSGHASSHRVAWLLKPAVAPEGASPRAIAEPALAGVAAAVLSKFDTASVDVEIRIDAAAAPAATVTARLVQDLGLAPLDLVLGGESELRLRAQNFVLRQWASNVALQAALGPLPHSNLGSFLARERRMTVRMDKGTTTAATLVATAASLRGIIQRGRVLDSSDLNAAARPDRPLTDALEAALFAGAAADLANRCKALAARLGTDKARARAALASFLLKARNYRNGLDAAVAELELSMRFAQVETARADFDDALLAISRYCEPAALRPFATGEVALAPDAFAPGFEAMLARLDAKAEQLNAAAQAVSASPANAAAARRMVATLSGALQDALDGDALSILLVFAKRAETTMETDFSGGAAVAAALADWAPQRARIKNASDLMATIKNARAFTITDAATTITGDPDPDERPEEEAPRSRFFGTMVADKTWVGAAGSYAGLVIDEWAEQRPSRSQMTGVAVNYDSPQSEAPNCLLLCEPPNGDEKVWTEDRAARMVAETIAWMQIRALPAYQRLPSGGQLPRINQVPFKPGPGNGKRRIPLRPLVTLAVAGALEGAFVSVAAAQPAGLAASGANEISGLNRTEG